MLFNSTAKSAKIPLVAKGSRVVSRRGKFIIVAGPEQPERTSEVNRRRLLICRTKWAADCLPVNAGAGESSDIWLSPYTAA